jgi:hypothetical protein
MDINMDHETIRENAKEHPRLTWLYQIPETPI